MAPFRSTLAVLALGLLCSPLQVNAHGYISTPPSRQASCKTGEVSESDCDGVTYEPQSVETPKGGPFERNIDGHLCNGGGSRFEGLNKAQDGLWPHSTISGSEDLNVEWTITTAHKTESWTYYITKAGAELDPSKPLTADDFEEEPILVMDKDHDAPPSTVKHTIPKDGLANHSGYNVIYGVWAIGDTGNAFYNCVDVDIQGGEAAKAPASSTATTMATSTKAASTGTAVSGTGVQAAKSTSTGAVGYSANSNSTVLQLSGRRVRRSF